MKKLILIVAILYSVKTYSQNDSIVCKNGLTAIGEITLVNDNNIFYTNKKGVSDYIQLSGVKYFVNKGNKVFPNLIEPNKIYLTTGDSIAGVASVIDSEHVRITRPDGTTTVVLTSMVKDAPKAISLGDFAGDHLISATKRTYTGMVITIVGAGLAVIGAVVTIPMVAIIGGGAIIVGYIYGMTAWGEISIAGQILKQKGI